MSWLHSPPRYDVRDFHIDLATRLYFTQAFNPNMIGDTFDSQTLEVRAGLTGIRAYLAELPLGQRFNRLGIELQIEQLTALLTWLVTCREALELHAYIQIKNL